MLSGGSGVQAAVWPMRFELLMPHLPWIALAGFAVAAGTMLLVTQYKERMRWPVWLIPAAAFVPVAALTAFAIAADGLDGIWPVATGSPWGIQSWFDRLAAVTVAFFLIQNRARAAGMKSEIWVIVVIFAGSLGLLPMLARMLDLERRRTLPPISPGPADPAS